MEESEENKGNTSVQSRESFMSDEVCYSLYNLNVSMPRMNQLLMLNNLRLQWHQSTCRSFIMNISKSYEIVSGLSVHLEPAMGEQKSRLKFWLSLSAKVVFYSIIFSCISSHWHEWSVSSGRSEGADRFSGRITQARPRRPSPSLLVRRMHQSETSSDAEETPNIFANDEQPEPVSLFE